MNDEEWKQIREFIRYHTEREVFAGYGYCLTEVRNLDTGRKIRTIKLVPVLAATGPRPEDVWKASDARRYFGLLPVTSLRPAVVAFDLSKFDSSLVR
jgi:hypothetical protein